VRLPLPQHAHAPLPPDRPGRASEPSRRPERASADQEPRDRGTVWTNRSPSGGLIYSPIGVGPSGHRQAHPAAGPRDPSAAVGRPGPPVGDGHPADGAEAQDVAAAEDGPHRAAAFGAAVTNSGKRAGGILVRLTPLYQDAPQSSASGISRP